MPRTRKPLKRSLLRCAMPAESSDSGVQARRIRQVRRTRKAVKLLLIIIVAIALGGIVYGA